MTNDFEIAATISFLKYILCGCFVSKQELIKLNFLWASKRQHKPMVSNEKVFFPLCLNHYVILIVI